MGITGMRFNELLFGVIALLCLSGCGQVKENNNLIDEVSGEMPELPALLASRFTDLDALKKVVDIKYDTLGIQGDSVVKGRVTLIYQSDGHLCTGELTTGVSQNDIVKVRDGGKTDALKLLFNSPFAISNRVALNRIYKLSRRRPVLFGEGDVAFFDLALESVKHIYPTPGVYQNERDSSEKGYLNTFNHITAQALITSIFDQEMADFVADVHERENMPELIYGNFSEAQLRDPNNNPVDNYVDIVNNELGQQLGILLKSKYGLTYETVWTAELLASYLNDIQQYYSTSFSITIKPFRASDLVIIKFINKMCKSITRMSYYDN